MMNDKQTVVITGAAGFIGGYLVREALNSGFKVVGIDNLSKYGVLDQDSYQNSDYKFVNGDATDSKLLYQYFENADHIIAGAAMIGGISYFHTYAYDLLATNERIIAATCDAAIKAFQNGKLIKLTYLSSSMVYESTSKWPSHEGDELQVPPPKSSYGFQKLAVEFFAKAAWQQYSLPYTILRPFNCIGIGEKRALGDKEIKSGNVSLAMSHVVPDLIQKILKGQDPVHILGNGNQVRCYTYGEDLAKGVIASLNNKDALNNDFNLSNKRETTVLELCQIIWKKIHGVERPFNFTCDPAFEFDVQNRVPDTTKAKEILGFEAKTSLEIVLDEVIPWVDEAIKKQLI